MPFLDTWRSPFEPVLHLTFAGGGLAFRPRPDARDEPDPAHGSGSGSGSGSGVGVGVGVGAGVGVRSGSLDEAAGVVLAQIERLEVEKARLEGRLVDAYAALHTIEEQQLARLVTRAPVPLTAEQVVTQEIACATGVGAGEVSRRLELAVAPRRHRVLRERLRAGSVGLYRALQVVAETRLLDDDVLPELEAAVLAPAPDGSVASQRLFATRLRRCVRSADSRGAEQRRRAAVGRRTAYGRLVEDGMGTFTVVATAERVVGVLDRVEALARSARAAGDERTLEQLRSDVLCDLALYGTVPLGPLGTVPLGPLGTVPVGARALGSVPAGATPTAGAVGVGSGPGCVDAGEASGGVPALYARLLGQAPPAVVRIVVPFEVAAGVSDAACEIPGHGWVTAAHARRIMTAPGSVWQRLAVEVDTGRALELSTDRYAPTPAMVAHVQAVDGVCRAPGCQVPAQRCDLDHIVPWPRGQTRVSNVESLSRGCHNGKTAGVWVVERVEDHGISWTSLAGREYITYPKDWREALHDPGSGPPAQPPAEPRPEVPNATPPEEPPHSPADDPPPF